MQKAKDLVLSTVHPASLVDMLFQEGVAREDILRGTHLNSGQLEDIDQFVTFEQYCRIMENGIACTGDPALGLRLGNRLNVTGHRELGLAVVSSSNFYEALQIIIRYVRILAPFGSFTLEWEDDSLALHVEYTVAITNLKQALTDVAYGALGAACRVLIPPHLLEMSFYYDTTKPADTAAYDSQLPGEVVWDAGWRGLKISREAALSPIATANPLTVRQIEKRLSEFMQRLGSKSEALLPSVRKIIKENPGFIPGMDEVADRLHMSPRTLNRRLQEVGTTYKEVVADVRRSLAIDYLRAGTHSVDEISDLLGYSNPSNFGKAFKTWTGYSPTQYRTVH